MVGIYDTHLIVLSIAVAIIASYVALDLASRVAASQGSKAARYWLIGGAISMGTGIWSMHFIGMLAFRLPIPMSYQIPITLLSLLIAVVVSGFALYTVSYGTLSMPWLLGAGLLMGIGIAAMHYTGMAAMQTQPPIRYDPFLFVLSILIAIAASLTALWIAFQLRLGSVAFAFWKKGGSALVMGGAIAGMHYTGMAAANFAPDSVCTVSPQEINNIWLASTIGAFSLVFLAATLLISVFDASFGRSIRLAATLGKANIALAEHGAKLSEGNALLRQEVEERIAAQTALWESEERYRQMVEHSPDGIFIQSEGKITFVNNTLVKLLGAATAEQLVGTPVLSIFHPDFREIIEQRIRPQEEANLAAPSFEARIINLGGSTVDVEVTMLPFTDRAKPGAQVVMRDISDRRRAEETLLRSQKMEALGTLAGGIAHDFNNILLAITGNIKLAIADLPADHPVQPSLTEVHKASGRAADLVRRILTFSRQQEPKREVMQLRPVVEEVLKLLRSTLPAMIEIRTNFAETLPAVAADVTQIHQVVLNLVTNAAHAIGEKGGLIEVRVDTFMLSAEMALLTPDLGEGRYLRFSVSDNGCGMDEDTRKRIFDPFFTTKAVGLGTGLGLSTVHGIVKNHEGAISVYSALGKGTTFHLYFPAVAAGVEKAPARAHPVSRGHGERILYVDDEDALVLLASRMLRRLGYDVLGYTDPSAALHAFQANPDGVDAIVTDLSMPGMSGFELARALLRVRPDVPIVMTSGYLRPEDQTAALNLGIRDLILKPNTVEELGLALDRLFAERPIPGETAEGEPHDRA
jgi:PAS domain S-box-containing protein